MCAIEKLNSREGSYRIQMASTWSGLGYHQGRGVNHRGETIAQDQGKDARAKHEEVLEHGDDQ